MCFNLNSLPAVPRNQCPVSGFLYNVLDVSPTQLVRHFHVDGGIILNNQLKLSEVPRALSISRICIRHRWACRIL